MKVFPEASPLHPPVQIASPRVFLPVLIPEGLPLTVWFYTPPSAQCASMKGAAHANHATGDLFAPQSPAARRGIIPPTIPRRKWRPISARRAAFPPGGPLRRPSPKHPGHYQAITPGYIQCTPAFCHLSSSNQTANEPSSTRLNSKSSRTIEFLPVSGIANSKTRRCCVEGDNLVLVSGERRLRAIEEIFELRLFPCTTGRCSVLRSA